MNVQPGKTKTIEAERKVALGHVQRVRESWDAPIDVFATTPAHHVELALLPQSGSEKACFPEFWGPNRFEPIGTVFLFPAEQPVRARSNCRRQNSIVCSFDPSAVGIWLDDPIEWSHGRLKASLDIRNIGVCNLLFQLGRELRSPGFASDTMIELMSAQLVVELSRHLLGIEERKSFGGLAPWRLKLIDERLSGDDSLPSLGELAELCHLSVRQLTRAFAASRGQSIGRYVAECRIDRSRQWLRAGLYVKTVAHRAGFASASNFSTAFLRATGETPRQFQLRCGSRRVVVAKAPPH